ncbi:hypothetical protein HNR65_002153 [Desulfosalsimonas propionicica]|uniref:Ion transport domain-containing protein n=1 Tax=Desulfosalsimonas propionicica TaxID=332175 RepID=A0A7W0HL15_9BACT|nr:ion transporter [Desulfosalsimonas propionicica]MBA2881822.1 hypothetical protein [Desulfosalsimonas propionicica]
MQQISKAWDVFVDITTLIWFVVFIIPLVSDGRGAGWVGPVMAVIGGIYVIELVVIFRRSAGFWDFLRQAWLDLLLLIPFFRIFRVGRIARLFRLRRLARFVRNHKSLRRIARTSVIETSVEGLDLVQKTFERLSRFFSAYRR